MASQHDWELSKENVQPLREGRTMASLCTALNSDTDKEAEHEIKAMQNEFELELRTYSGSDPFDVWDRYIKWTEQYFPKGGHNGQLMALIERCLKEYQTEELYKNDPRFIRIWIKFASSSKEPGVVYSHMFDNGIGFKVAEFYCEWAVSLERHRDFKGADSIYIEGLNRLAQPKDMLLQEHQQFQQRVANNIALRLEDDANPGMEFGESDDKRMVLGRLKASEKCPVGTTRTGAISKGRAGFYKTSASSAKHEQVPGNKIAIFCDENAAPSVHLQQTNEWKSLPVRSEMNRENDKKPGTWTGAKVKLKSAVAVTVPSSNPFEIHEDQETSNPSETPRKTLLMNNQPLSSRKPAKYIDALSSLKAVQGVPNLNEGKPMYDKPRIYNGMHEFSFEELRAANHFKLKEVAEREAQRKKTEEMAKQLAAMTERLAQMEALVLSNEKKQNSAESSRCQNTSLNNSQRTPIFNSNMFYQNLSAASSGGSVGMVNSSHGSNSFSQSHLKLPNKGTCGSEGSKEREIFSVNQSDSLRSSGQEPLLSNSYADQIHSQLNHTATPKSHGASPESINSAKGGFVAPSPTVCTKEAMFMVQQLFSSSFDNSMASFDTTTSQGSQQSAAMPFQICEDRTTQLLQESEGAVAMQVNCDLPEDKENQGMRLTRQMADNQENGMQSKKGIGLQIHCDEPEEMFSTVKKRTNQLPQSSGRKGLSLQIYSDEMQESEENHTRTKKTVRRDLGFRNSESADDVEMSDMENAMVTLNQEFTIEYQARDDMTLEGLDKFTELARAASTPFSAQKTSKLTSSNETDGSLSGASPIALSNPDAQHLSPILEGSGEESKSHASSSASSCMSNLSTIQRSRHMSVPSNPEPIFEDEPAEEQDGDSSMLDDQCLDTTAGHLIDTTCYIPNQEEDYNLNNSMMVNVQNQNPFDDEYIAKILDSLDPPLCQYSNFAAYNKLGPNFVNQQVLNLGSRYLVIDKEIGKGGYAKVYKASEHSLGFDDDIVEASYSVLKVQSPPCPWEFYANSVIHHRLRKLNAPMDVKSSIVQVESGSFYKDISILELQFIENGSLLNLVNKYKGDKRLLSAVEPFACLLTIELLHMFEQIHACHMIHGDVKPDNFLLRNLPYLCENPSRQEVFGSHTQLVSLIDFGQSIDMEKFPADTSFTAKVETDGFQCIEMRTNRPWTYQTDLFGLAGTVHVVLLGAYMNVFCEKGQWKTTGAFNRKWNVQLWKEFFTTMLNIPSCNQLPDLAALRHKFEEYFLSKVTAYNLWVSDFKSVTTL